MAQQIGWYWSIVANYLYEAINRFMAVAAEADFMLTCREQACLNWAAKGKTSWEISQILEISERTVNFHLSNCIRKTNSCNRQQAISKCVAGGHIHM
jgi:DNA-binding CsgD family transcriptional regulator